MITVANITTLLISIFLLFSAYTYMFSLNTIEGIRELGLPDYMRIEFAILKVIAGILIWCDFLPQWIREWAYAGIFLFLLTGLIAHIVHKDSIGILITLLVLCALLFTSYFLKLK